MALAVKICGLSTPESVDAAVDGGARFVGFVFFPPSPRYVAPGSATELTRRVPRSVARVAVTVDPTDDELATILDVAEIDMVQLHGRETPERTAEIKSRFGRPVIKAISVAAEQDLDAVNDYASVADMILFDAKATKDDVLPGGNARTFDWRLLSGRTPRNVWFLSGGLNRENLASAVRESGATHVDVSSGIESSRGIKDVGLIKSFLAAANEI